MNKTNSYNLLGIEINNLSYDQILNEIKSTLSNNSKVSICYVNVNSFNISLSNENQKEIYSSFDFVHPDGVGVFLGSRFIFGKKLKIERLTGSDLYQQIIEKAILKDWKLFIFGDTEETLEKIKYNYPKLSVVGKKNGYIFENEKLLVEINNSKPDILIVGLGTPKQEEWIIKNKSNLMANVIIAVGDGIKVFSGTKKRGPKIFQKIGLEWFIRFLYEPKRLWKRYILGIPLFILRVLKYKLFKQ